MVTCDSPPFNTLHLIESGLLIASKYPIINSEFLPFFSGTNVDGLLHKGILYAKIEIPNGKHLHCFNSHI